MTDIPIAQARATHFNEDQEHQARQREALSQLIGIATAYATESNVLVAPFPFLTSNIS